MTTLIGSDLSLFPIPDFRAFASEGAPCIAGEMMTTVKENLIAAKEVFQANDGRWSFHQSVDYVAGDDNDDVYHAMMHALRDARPQVPLVKTDIVRWSLTATKSEVIFLFDRAIAAQDDDRLQTRDQMLRGLHS